MIFDFTQRAVATCGNVELKGFVNHISHIVACRTHFKRDTCHIFDIFVLREGGNHAIGKHIPSIYRSILANDTKKIVFFINNFENITVTFGI